MSACVHALTEESVSRRWFNVESIEGEDEDTTWCACCCGPSKGEFCTRCQDITPEQYQRLMGVEVDVAA